MSSGRDYTRATVGSVTATATAYGQGMPAQGGSGGRSTSPGDPRDNAGAEGSAPLRGPVELSRLTGPAEFAACTAAVVGDHGGRVTTVDFARFEGGPALVVVLVGAREAAGRSLVVVVGPACGRDGSGADERYAGRA
jgi:hypothetical protein